MSLFRYLLAVGLLAFSWAAVAAQPVNINNADSEALVDGLVGVGPQKALAIVRYRQQHGPFKRIEDLSLVDGIGAKTVEQNRPNIRLGAPADAKQ